MVLRAEQMFNKVYLDREHPSDFIDYIAYGVERELVDKVMDKLKDHKLFVVMLHEPRFMEDLPDSWYDRQCAYRQDLECMEVIQCKDCRMAFPWCQRFRDELGGKGYCPYGREIEDEQKRICLSSCEDCRHNGVKHAYDYACDKCTDMDKWEGE